MFWVYSAVLSGCLYGAYHFLIKLASGQMNQVLAAVVLQASALLVGCSLLVLLKIRGDLIISSSTGIRYAALAGLAGATGEIIAFFMFSRGVPASSGVPIIIGCAVAAAAFYSFLFLNEYLTALQWTGVAFVIIGIILLTTKGQVGI